MREASAPGAVPGWTSCVHAFEEEFDYLHRAVLRLGVSVSDAEDLVQDVFLVMWRRWADYQQDRPLRPWMIGIAAHLALQHKRRRGREVPAAQLDGIDEAPLAEDRLAAAGARATVLRALARLPPRQRLPLVMHDIDGISMNEIARSLSIPLATAYTRVRRARLAFAAIVRRTDGRASDPDSLLGAERIAPPAPAAVRRRAISRARAVVASPPAPPPAAPGPPMGWVSLGIGVTMAALAVATAARVRSAPAAERSSSAARAGSPDGEGAGLARGLVGDWRFDDGAGLRVADAARGNHCQLNGWGDGPSPWTDGPLGPALALGRRWLRCPQPPVAAGAAVAMTVAAWIQPRALRKFHGALASRDLPDGDEYFFFAVIDDALVVKSAAWGIYLRSPLGVLDHWVHVAFTHDRGGHTRLYVGGAPAGEAHDGAVRAEGLVTAPMLVGAAAGGDRPSGIQQRFYGAMDELLLYERALADEEIATLAAGARPR